MAGRYLPDGSIRVRSHKRAAAGSVKRWAKGLIVTDEQSTSVAVASEARIYNHRTLAPICARGGIVSRSWILWYPLLAMSCAAQGFHPTIPRAWDDHEVKLFELPLAQPDRSPRYISSGDYYEFKVRPVYRGYPIYFPCKEPQGYLDSLRQREPEIVFDPGRLRTEEDWIRAGELVFDAPTTYISVTHEVEPDMRGYYRAAPFHVTREGILPYFQYVVRKKGALELGVSGCAHCHTRVMPDGTALRGAQGDVPFAQRAGWVARTGGL